MRKSTVIKKLQKMFPDIDGIRCAEDWGGEGYKTAIHLGDIAEGGQIDDRRGADYYAWEYDPKEEFYILGVHKKMRDALEKFGYFPEWNDPGTIFAWPL